MRLILRSIVLAILSVLVATAAEAACKPAGKVLFQDQFDTLASSWGTFDNYHVDNGRLVIQPPAGFNTSTINSASLYDDVDVCVEMTVRPPIKKGNCGGIIFWAVDYDNYYTMQVSSDGQASIWRRQKGKWLNQIQLQEFNAVRRGANQVNEIRVVTAGSHARTFVNGKFFKEISGQPPEGGSEVGLIGCSPSNVSAPVDFDNFVVSAPGGGAPPPAVAAGGDAAPVSEACRPTDKTVFQDSFKDLAASWGTFDNYHAEGGKLVIQPPAGFNTATINNASLYDDVDICVEMNVAAPVVKNNCGSIIFWAVDYDNYYSLQVSSDGQAAVWRRQKGKWLNQINWQDFAAVHTGSQENTLRVVTSGSKAKFFVNGQLFKEFTGQPPDGGSQVGLLGCSPNDAAARIEFTNFIVSSPGGAVLADNGGGAAKLGPAPVAVAAGAKCEAPKGALYVDHFETLASSWGSYDNYKVDNGELLLTPPATYNTTVLNSASLYDDVDLCVDMKMRTTPQGTCGGLALWAEDYDNYYTFELAADGRASFWRWQRGKWLNQLQWQPVDGVATGNGAVNQLRVTTSGRTARLFVNGKLFKEVQGQPPAGGQEVGVIACSGEKEVSAVSFGEFVVAPAGAKVASLDVPEVKPAAPEVKPVAPEVKPVAPEVKPAVAEVKPALPVEELPATPQGRRVALVIGIGDYKAVPALPNPPRDAADIASELSAVGFDVTHLDNLDGLSMRKALRDFEQKADGASIALVYYAGHGMEVDGVNYLIPVDAVLDRDTHIDDEAIPLNRVLNAVGGARDLRLVLLDACRNNPFVAKMARADGSRAVTRGLARIEPGSSTLVAFSAKEGTTAEDGNGRNSPFAEALLANLKTRGLEISFLFRKVRDQVMSETGNRQEPFVYGSLSSIPIYLAGQ